MMRMFSSSNNGTSFNRLILRRLNITFKRIVNNLIANLVMLRGNADSGGREGV